MPTVCKATRPRRGLTITLGQTSPATEQPPKVTLKVAPGADTAGLHLLSFPQSSSHQLYSPQGPPSG